jgi:hypothetical protein
MVASLLRILTGSGVQDDRLKSSVNINNYKKVWRKVGRFTTRWERIDFIDIPDFNKTRYANINLRGEFITRMFLVCDLPDIAGQQLAAATTGGTDISQVYPSFGWTNSVGHALIQEAALEIDGVDYDILNSQLLEIVDEYWTPYEKLGQVNKLIGRADSNFSSKSFGRQAAQPQRVYVPLPFWFARGDAAAALPVDSLSKSQIRVRITFRNIDGCYYTESRDISGVRAGDGSALWNIRGSSFYKKVPTGIKVPGLLPPGAGSFVEPIAGINMPAEFHLGDCYLMAEYVYVDKYEAHMFRSSDIRLPIIQHVEIPTVGTGGANMSVIPMRIGNPVRGLYWIAQREEVAAYNAHFLATRDFKDTGADVLGPWWPDACGGCVLPAFSTRSSEPFKEITLVYEGKQIRYQSEVPATFRSIIPSLECIKTPWHNKYYYTMRFGVGGTQYPLNVINGAANMDKIQRIEMRFLFNPIRGTTDVNVVPRYTIRIWVETYNMMRVYGGRATLMFAN